eukprot:2945467-Pleurochrysis_carterae.AAC.1
MRRKHTIVNLLIQWEGVVTGSRGGKCRLFCGYLISPRFALRAALEVKQNQDTQSDIVQIMSLKGRQQSLDTQS